MSAAKSVTRKVTIVAGAAGAAQLQNLLIAAEQQKETQAEQQLMHPDWAVHCIARSVVFWARNGQQGSIASVTQTAALLAGVPESWIFDDEYPLHVTAWKEALHSVVVASPECVLLSLHLPSLRYAMQHLTPGAQAFLADQLSTHLGVSYGH
jgi:hypothetical protein